MSITVLSCPSSSYHSVLCTLLAACMICVMQVCILQKCVRKNSNRNKAVILNQTWESAVTKDEENRAKFIHKFRIYRLFTFTAFSSIGIAYQNTF